jgi:hypothetical protein
MIYSFGHLQRVFGQRVHVHVFTSLYCLLPNCTSCLTYAVRSNRGQKMLSGEQYLTSHLTLGSRILAPGNMRTHSSSIITTTFIQHIHPCMYTHALLYTHIVL